MEKSERLLLTSNVMRLSEEDLAFITLVATCTLMGRQGGNVIRLEGEEVVLMGGMREAKGDIEALWEAYREEIRDREDDDETFL